MTELYKNSIISQFGENAPVPVEDADNSNKANDEVPADTSTLEECSRFIKYNRELEALDTDGDDIPDIVLEEWEDCDGNELESTHPVRNITTNNERDGGGNGGSSDRGRNGDNGPTSGGRSSAPTSGGSDSSSGNGGNGDNGLTRR